MVARSSANRADTCVIRKDPLGVVCILGKRIICTRMIHMVAQELIWVKKNYTIRLLELPRSVGSGPTW